jgi:hypothetical protein
MTGSDLNLLDYTGASRGTEQIRTHVNPDCFIHRRFNSVRQLAGWRWWNIPILTCVLLNLNEIRLKDDWFVKKILGRGRVGLA